MDNSEIPSTHRRAAWRWYSTDGVRDIMTAHPGSETFEKFERWVRQNDAAFIHLWGLPDFQAALDSAGLTAGDFANLLSITDDEAEEYILGVRMPSMYGLVTFAYLIGWPIGKFFRGPAGWHPRTRAARRIGFPKVTW